MPGAPYDFSLKLGETHVETFGDYDETPAIIDYSSGFTAQLVIWDSDGNVILTLTDAAGDIALAATDPNISVTFDNADIVRDNFTADESYDYDLVVIDASSDPDCVAQGKITIIDSNPNLGG